MSVPTAEEFRAVGFTETAASYPLSERAFTWLCKFNGIALRDAPRAWRYAPNPYMQDWLDRAASIAGFEGGPLPKDSRP